ncbi:MAG: hypothetical protein M1831_002101 [Alyxoria varia]|nr:MAG: hypothetical protein M1831_002101 [Alyxoria varia]
MEMNTDETELQRLQEELQVEILPGTEIMKDVGSHHFVKSDSSDRVLVPQPCDDPHDPLNWSTFWKVACIVNASWISFTQGYGPLSLAPMEESYIEEFHTNLTDALQFTGVAILVLGFSNFIWVPITTTFGRRPTALMSQVLNLGSAIWRAEANSYGSFMGASVLNGIAGGPAETLQPAIIADLFFLHDRGKWNTLYFLVYFGGLMVGPIMSGPMAANVGWRSFWWLYVAVIALSIVATIFINPETMYHRQHPNEKYDDTSKRGVEKKLDAALSQDEKKSDSFNSHRREDAPVDSYLGKGWPSKKQFALWQSNPKPFKTLLISFWTPWKLFVFPIVLFASFIVSFSASCFLTLNLTQLQVFAEPPYNFTPTHIGFCNFAILVGALIGLATAGPLSDWFAMRLTLRNNGIREPEMRLPAMIPYVVIMIFGNVINAVGYEHRWPWPAIVVVGYAATGIQVAALPAFASTYAVDSYKPVAASLFVAITINKNVYGYGFSKYLTPWIIESGYIKPIMLNMSLTTLWCLSGIIFYYYGKTFRRWSKNSDVHKM